MNKKNEKMVMCLCGRCVNSFFQTHKYRIIRVDPYNPVRESCTLCRLGRGYDYIIAPRYTKRPPMATARSVVVRQEAYAQ